MPRPGGTLLDSWVSTDGAAQSVPESSAARRECSPSSSSLSMGPARLRYHRNQGFSSGSQTSMVKHSGCPQHKSMTSDTNSGVRLHVSSAKEDVLEAASWRAEAWPGHGTGVSRERERRGALQGNSSEMTVTANQWDRGNGNGSSPKGVGANSGGLGGQIVGFQ